MYSPGSIRLREVFQLAVEAPAAQRGAVLSRACGNDERLRGEVLSLLAAHDESADVAFMAGATLGATPGDDARPPATRVAGLHTAALALAAERPGDQIGHYRLVRRVGEGGFGSVYLAEQEYPVRRNAALKIIRPGMDTEQVIRRFEAERQALALMDHPGIARVFDAGSTASGRPFFVMEFVDGVPFTDYCDRNRLNLPQRLDLFVQVCRAVQHAHQKGIIHRDLKPSNVLVTRHEDAAVPKVIDFGIAKAMDVPPGARGAVTEQRQFVGTPAYMSPEQAETGGANLDTRSDIYSLGVLLYELLTGTTPFEAALRGKEYGEIQRVLRELEAQPPSERLRALGGEMPEVAARRGTDARRLVRAVRKELDWIALKCLEKDRTRRYETANALALDVLRHLEGRPVAARPTGRAYRACKFARRHRAAVAAASAALCLLVAGVVGTSVGLVRARSEAARAEATLQLVEGIFLSARPPAEGGAGATDLAQLIGHASSEVDRHLADQPLARLRGRRLLALTRQAIGEYAEAEADWREALSLAEVNYGSGDARTLEIANLLTAARARNITPLSPIDPRAAEADHAAREVLREARRQFGDDHRLTLEATAAHAHVLLVRKEYLEAQRVYEGLIRRAAARRDVSEPTGPGTPWSKWSGAFNVPVGPLLARAGEPDAARIAGWGLQLARAMLAQESAGTAAACLKDLRTGWELGGHARNGIYPRITYDLARVWAQRNQLEDASKLYGQTVDLLLSSPGTASDPDTCAAIDGHADLLEQLGRVHEAWEVRRDQLKRAGRWGGRGGGDELSAERLFRLAVLEHYVGRRDHRDELFTEAVGLRQRCSGRDDAVAAAWWRVWMMTRGPGSVEWANQGLRNEIWMMLTDRLRRQPSRDLAADSLQWHTFRFDLFRWDGDAARCAARPLDRAAAADVLARAKIAEGDLATLATLDPGHGLYLLSVRVETDRGPVRELAWVPLAPWDLCLYPFTGNMIRNEEWWRDTIASPPPDRRRAVGLSVASGAGYDCAGPNRRTRSFGMVATATLQLPPGPYRISCTADDGVRVWTGAADRANRPTVDTWRLPPKPDGVVACGDDGLPLRVEFFQADQEFSLRVALKPDLPGADALVSALLGGSPDDLRRWLVREGAELNRLHRRQPARDKFVQAVPAGDAAPSGPNDAVYWEAVQGLAATARDHPDAVEHYRRLFDRYVADFGLADDRTLDVGRHLVLNLRDTGQAEQARRAGQIEREMRCAEAAEIDAAIDVVNRVLASHPDDRPGLRRRADLCGRRGRFDVATRDLARLIALESLTVDDWYFYGILLAAGGNESAYREHCRSMFQRFGASHDSSAKRRVVKTCGLGDVHAVDARVLASIADAAAASDSGNPWSRQICAMARYRAGEFEAAAALLDGQGPPGAGAATNHALLAMARFRCGRAAEAHDALKTAMSRLLQVSPPAGQPLVYPAAQWHDWTVCGILVKEAQRLAAAAPPS